MDLSFLSERAKNDFKILSTGNPFTADVFQIEKSQSSIEERDDILSAIQSFFIRHDLYLSKEKYDFDVLFYSSYSCDLGKMCSFDFYHSHVTPRKFMNAAFFKYAPRLKPMRINCSRTFKNKFDTHTVKYSLFILME